MVFHPSQTVRTEFIREMILTLLWGLWKHFGENAEEQQQKFNITME